MNRLAGLFGNKKEDDRNKLTTLQDSSKPMRKRLSTLLQLHKSFDKPGYSERLDQFFKESAAFVPEICLSILDNFELPQNIKRKSIWEEISSILRLLIDFTKYGHKEERLQEISRLCLLTDNKWEIKDLGFLLALYMLDNDMNQQIPFWLLLFTLDFSLFAEDTSRAILPDRTMLTGVPQAPWLLAASEVLKKSGPPDIKEFDKYSEMGLSYEQRECLHFFSKLLEFSLGLELQPSERPGHFRKWFELLQHTFLYLLYPHYGVPSPIMGSQWGFKGSLPNSLHYLVVNWLITVIYEEDLREHLFATKEDYEYVTDLLGESFMLVESYSTLSYIVANSVMKLYKDWIFKNNLPSIVRKNYEVHLRRVLTQSIQLFDFSRDASTHRQSLCNDIVLILCDYREVCNLWTTFLDCSLKMAEKLVRTHSPDKDLSSIVEPMAEFALHTLVKGARFVDWDAFCAILKQWARNSPFVIEKWKFIMIELSEKLKKSRFTETPLLDYWLHMLHILGNPLEFNGSVQNKWAYALNTLIVLIVNPAHLSASTNTLLRFFFPTLSNLVRKGFSESTQQIALQSLFEIFIKTKSDEQPLQVYIEHFCFLLHTASKVPYLQDTILAFVSHVFVYPEMHCLIPALLRIANSQAIKPLPFLFSVLSYPNYYGETELQSFDSQPVTYASLGSSISSLLNESSEENSLGLFALTTHIVEELLCSGRTRVELVRGILQKCVHSDQSYALSAISCTKILSHYLSSSKSMVLDFLVHALTKVNSNEEKLVKALLNCTQRWLMSGPTTDFKLVSQLFQAVNSLQLQSRKSSIQNALENFTVFVCVYLNNFPLKRQGPEVVQSIMSDTEFSENEPYLHFALGHSVIVSMPTNRESAKLVLRNPFGKFAFQAQHFQVFEPSTLSEEFDRVRDLLLSSSVALHSAPAPQELNTENLLSELYNFLEKQYGVSIFKDIPTGRDYESIDEVEAIEANWRRPTQRRAQPAPEGNMARFLLAHSGLLHGLVPLEKGEKLERGLNLLDADSPRESLKIGVTYVKAFQQNEREILKNDSGSQNFQLFVQALGSTVDLKTHIGNLGGLDPEGSNGKVAIAYADWENDIIFHVVPLMPTVPTCDQQLLKKRHVGNDNVNIVWSEEYREYRIDTILTHLNTVSIVIYPLQSSLYRIQIFKKLEVEFGPLQDGMVVPWAVLPSLVRETAVNANTQIRATKTIKLESKVQLRKKQIQDLVQWYSLFDTPPAEIYASII